MKEFYAMKNYSKINKGLAVLVGILLSPFILATIALSWVCYIVLVAIAIFEAPGAFLNKYMLDTSKQVSAAAQFMIYFFGFPVVFAYYCAIASLMIACQVLFLFLQIFGWLGGIGGITFQPFLLIDLRQKPMKKKADLEIEDLEDFE